MTGNFQVSSKLNDGRIFVVSADTYLAFCEALEQAVGITESQDVLKTMGQSILGAPQSMAQAQQNVRDAFAPVSDYPTQTNTASPSGKTCKHGPMTPRTGNGAKGPWKAYMCPSPKGTPDQCEPEWIRRNEAAWNSF